MIRALYTLWLRRRAKHHAGRAQIFGMAVLAAQQRRDFTTAAYFWEQLDKARSKRDRLTLRASALESPPQDRWMFANGETCPPCNCNCEQGDRCPARCRR